MSKLPAVNTPPVKFAPLLSINLNAVNVESAVPVISSTPVISPPVIVSVLSVKLPAVKVLENVPVTPDVMLPLLIESVLSVIVGADKVLPAASVTSSSP